MIALKKLYGDELLRLALMLSLLRVDPSDYLQQETQQLAGLQISNGSDWALEMDQEARTLIRPRYVHPKSLDNILMNYERQIFEELNSLGRYGNVYRVENDWNRPVLHTYVLNGVATNTVAAALSDAPVLEQDPAADDNVAQEVISEDTETDEEVIPQPDAVVTLSADFLQNHTEDIFAELATRSFDVNELLNQPDEMQIKKEPEDDLLGVKIKKETDHDHDLYSDNAHDDFIPFFTSKTDKYEVGDPDSVFNQNMADLQDYGELFDDVKELKSDLECLDVKQQDNLEQYLLENTPLDTEVYELGPIFEEELVVDVKRERASTSFTSASSSSGVSEMDTSGNESPDVKSEPDEGHHTGDELTQEDMDLIEVLWKQDVDMGFSIEPLNLDPPQATKVAAEDFEKKLQSAEEKYKKKDQDEEEEIEKVKAALLDTEVKEDDPWAGLSYTVDTETGEYVLQGALPSPLPAEQFDLLQEALELVELGDDAGNEDDQSQAVEGSSSAMLHPAMRHVPHHPLAHYPSHHQSLMRTVSAEQRWQDLASLLTLPPPPDQYPHYHHQHPHPHPHPHPHHNISAHGAASYAPNYHHGPLGPAPEKHPDAYGSAAGPLEGAYKVEAHHSQQHDQLYYQNTTSEMPPPGATGQDGFLQSILNDEDLQLMDMAMNEGMYTMRMLDGASAAHAPVPGHSHMMMTERDSASDSAVSSMGSERVPSLSDGEWCDGSDSAQEFHSSKFRPYDSGYGRERGPPPQKKHHMFGKRCFQDQQQPALEPLVPRPAVKYECPEQAYHHDMQGMHTGEFPRAPLPTPVDLNAPHSSHALLQNNHPSTRYQFAAERARHNHTYSAPPAPHDTRLAVPRDKRVRRLTETSVESAGHLSRDEKRAKALGIPMEVHDIINLPMDEFNERLSKHDLSEAQLSLIRDIRRRGKNKVAAQNCRKRKLDQITCLADEVRTVRDRKVRTQRDHHTLLQERQRAKERFAALYRHVFQHLRDGEGRALSSSQFSLQQAADGSVVLVPKMGHSGDHPMNRSSDDEMDRKAKNYEQ